MNLCKFLAVKGQNRYKIRSFAVTLYLKSGKICGIKLGLFLLSLASLLKFGGENSLFGANQDINDTRDLCGIKKFPKFLLPLSFCF